MQRTPQQRLSLCVTPLLDKELRQIAQTLADVGVFVGQRLFPHRQRPLVKRLGLCEPPLLAINLRQIVDALGDIEVPEWQRLLAKLQRAPQELLRLA
jgi:hypothetical protein